MYSNKQINNNNEIDLIEIFITIWKHKLKVFLCLVLALFIFFFITNQKFKQTIYYKIKIEPFQLKNLNIKL